MKEIIEKIKRKFGMSVDLTLHMDGSGSLRIGFFDQNTDEDFKIIHFQSINELENILA